ncbi:MAG: bifunctional riboflavin kinase/FAD synthetase [Anaerolineae bacterium]|nr:bifunctional riboflavin kinase/FAD synthetase [Anaerolineae bacterium]MBL8104271.1 bifunctional riboflavin kinase/FAD synthetase [Anaerolineales bacterium]MCC7188917.1 bifunctional riboflavin kinase/FAD synthetase [Anaerolineales bacterium]
MNHYRSLEEIALQKSWLTVGVFDGVHRGHQQIIQKLVEGARADGASSVVLTFDPHPSKVFGRGDIKLLTLPDERAEILGNMGVDVVITHPFNREVANITAFDFMQRLKSYLGLDHLVLGYDSALGKDREGNIPRLTEIGSELGYTVETVPALSDESGVISSTAIRKLVTVGKVEEAAKLLGHPYRLRGVVIRGDQRGRRIGFPTANLDYAVDKLIPAGGIYACWAYVNGEKFRAAVNIGTNPTFTPDKKTMSVEAYMLDFDRDIYDENLQLEFEARLRDELKFDSVEALIAQIKGDVERVRQIFR